MQRIWQAFLIILILLITAGGALACVGARPLGMGGAYVARGDSNSVYWNPAGLVELDSRAVGFTYTLNNRDYFNYDLFVTYVEPDYGTGAGGLSLVTTSQLRRIDGSSGKKLYDRQQWFVYSIGRRLGQNLSGGLNVRYERYGTDETTGTNWTSRLGFDGGFQFTPTSWLRLGVLLQDLWGLDLTNSEGASAPGPGLNIRPGLAVYPDEKTVLAVDVYDLLGSFRQRSFRFGGERWLFDSFAIRTGWEVGMDTDRLVWTAGASYRHGDWTVDYAYLGRDLGGTHQLGLEVRF